MVFDYLSRKVKRVGKAILKTEENIRDTWQAGKDALDETPPLPDDEQLEDEAKSRKITGNSRSKRARHMKKKDLDKKCETARQKLYGHAADATVSGGVASAVILKTGGLAAHKFAITKLFNSLESNGDTWNQASRLAVYESERSRRGHEYDDPDFEEMGREMWKGGKRGLFKQLKSEVKSAVRHEAFETSALAAGIEVERFREAHPDTWLGQHLPAVPEITQPSKNWSAPRYASLDSYDPPIPSRSYSTPTSSYTYTPSAPSFQYSSPAPSISYNIPTYSPTFSTPSSPTSLPPVVVYSTYNPNQW